MTDSLLVLAAVSILIGIASYLLLRGGTVEDPPRPTAAPQPLPVPPPAKRPTKIRHALTGRVSRQLGVIEKLLQQPVATPPPPPAPLALVPPPSPPKAPAPMPRNAPRTVRLRLVSAKGRPLMEQSIDVQQRRPTYRHRTADGLVSVFAADHQDPDGVWVYRRVGVEREH